MTVWVYQVMSGRQTDPPMHQNALVYQVTMETDTADVPICQV